MAYTIPRESAENIPVEVTVNGEPVLAGFRLAYYLIGEQRPETYAAPIVAGQITYLHVEGLQPGAYAIQALHDDGVAVDLGYFTVT